MHVPTYLVGHVDDFLFREDEADTLETSQQILPTFTFKGTVSRKITGVKSGINR